MAERMGRIKWFNALRGYGFIEPDDGSGDVFLHADVVIASGMPLTTPGARVAFESAMIDGGLRATALRIAGVDAQLASELMSRARELRRTNDTVCRDDAILMEQAARALFAVAMRDELGAA